MSIPIPAIKQMMVAGLLLVLTGCLKPTEQVHRKGITANAALIALEDETYRLSVDYDNGKQLIIDSVEQVGWKADEILVYGRKGDVEGWAYIIDDGSMENFWGMYSHKEFEIRAMELDIEDAFRLYHPKDVIEE